MSNDYERIRAGIEFMTAYVSGDQMLGQYTAARRRESAVSIEEIADGTAALCALLLQQLARDAGKTPHAILQEYAKGTHRHEQGREPS